MVDYYRTARRAHRLRQGHRRHQLRLAHRPGIRRRPGEPGPDRGRLPAHLSLARRHPAGRRLVRPHRPYHHDSLPVFGHLHENIHYGIGWAAAA
ncbi:hypothetical protein ACPA9J_33545 [Pseudomonas aeruginosa]